MEKTFDEAFKEYHEALERERKEAEESKVYADEYFSELARQQRERQDYINFCIIRAGELADEERQEKARAGIAAVSAATREARADCYDNDTLIKAAGQAGLSMNKGR